jgi:ABC-type lipoprotein export system ATPase subunit
MNTNANHSGRSCGSLWHRWDLHFHTPSSFDYEDASTTDQQIVDGLLQKGVRVIGVTDHHVIDVTRIRSLKQIAGGRLTVLPGIEFRSDQGGDPIHYIGIFPEDCDLEHVWTVLQGRLGLTSESIRTKGGHERIYVPIEDGAKVTRELGGVVSIHAGTKSNSIESIKNKEQFQQRLKLDLTRDWVDILEIGQVKDIDVHLKTIFPATGLDRPLVICSDNHNIRNYAVKVPLWFRADPTFRGLLMVLREPHSRVFIGSRPDDEKRVEASATKYIKKLRFTRRDTAPPGQSWFDGELDLNPGLVAIIGNKGNGKSALTDTIGLLGCCKNTNSFSFLNEERFCHPTAGHAQHFDATLEWASGETQTSWLASKVTQNETERVKYLPQDHVEGICNEVLGVKGSRFEEELKAVIFSHVPESERLGQTSLDDLVLFQTSEKQKRIDVLLGELRALSRNRALLESHAHPVHQQEVESKIRAKEAEIAAHVAAKPAEVKDPSGTSSTASADGLLHQALVEATTARKVVAGRIEVAQKSISQAQRRLAVGQRLLEKVTNFTKEVAQFRSSLEDDAKELGVDAGSLVEVTVNTADLQKLLKDTEELITNTNQILGTDASAGLLKEQRDAETRLESFQAQLDAPTRFYQAYLRELGLWQGKQDALTGTESNLAPDSLKGLQAELQSMAELPAKLAAVATEQRRVALEIQAEKNAQAEVYRQLYKPVQTFIDSHSIAKDKLRLEFRAELLCQGFGEKLLRMLALNRRGSFMGTDEGLARANGLVRATDWGSAESVAGFLDQVDSALHSDMRTEVATPTHLSDQLARDHKPEDVYDLVYGLEYAGPRYVLKWDGKELAMLSPGERGALLLVFYLLIDKGDMPLVIDQPEGNLDNHTIAKTLVECIKEARKRRQVFIVTHNPNLAVVCDADQVIHTEISKSGGNAIRYTTGALEDPVISEHVTNVLEGTRWAFDVRGGKYDVAKKDHQT